MTKPIRTKHLDVTPVLDEADARMMYQAYRLNTVPEGWKLPKNLSPTEFIEITDEGIRTNYDMNWSVRNGEQPLCILFAKDASKFLLLGDIVWWPKAGKKAKVEACAAVLDEIREHRVGLIEAEYKYKKFYELLADRKILRRVGSLYDTIEKGSRTTFFQTRAV